MATPVTSPHPTPERVGKPLGGGVRENEPRPTLERVGAPSDGTVSVCLSKRPMVATAVMMIATPRSATGPGCSPRKRIAAKNAIAGPEPRAAAYTADRATPNCCQLARPIPPAKGIASAHSAVDATLDHQRNGTPSLLTRCAVMFQIAWHTAATNTSESATPDTCGPYCSSRARKTGPPGFYPVR